MKKTEKIDIDKLLLSISELRESHKETAKIVSELAIESKITDKQLKELGKQIGGIGNKFGTFTEGLAHPTITKVLTKKFKVEYIQNNLKNVKKGIEIDVVGYSNSNVNEVYIVEIKSHLKEEHIDQLLKLLGKFKNVFPEHKDKKIYAIMASVTTNADLKEKLNKLGIYHATSGENLFKLDSPKNFKPKAY